MVLRREQELSSVVDGSVSAAKLGVLLGELGMVLSENNASGIILYYCLIL